MTLQKLGLTFYRLTLDLRPVQYFFQFITKVATHAVIIKYFSIPSGESFQQDVSSVTYEEVNALRYSSGYVIHSLVKKVKKSGQPMKKELLICLQELKEKEG